MNRTMLFAAIAIAVLGAVLFSVRKKRYVERVTGGDMRPILMLIETVEAGQPIYHTSLQVVYRPAAYVESRHVGYEDRLNIIGLRASHTLHAGMTLVWSDLLDTSGGQKADTLISETIQSGHRALTVQIESATFPGLLSSGDNVDVFYSAIQGGISRNTTVLLAQNVAIVRDESQRELAARDSSLWVRNVTLATDPQQGLALRHAAQNGYLFFAVRHRDDARLIDALPYVTAEDLVGEAVVDNIRERRARPAQVQAIERL